jgi:predicted dehydrogenase
MAGEKKVRWGFLSTAQIGRKNWKAVKQTGNSTVTAVASRELEKARQFVRECQAQAPMDEPPQAFGNYEELLASRDVDAVYIPLPTGVRKEWVLRAAKAGKHVVCEKPCATSLADLREMIDACHDHNVQFMDGVMFMHSARMEGMRQVLDDGATVGQLQRITSAFSFSAQPEFFDTNIRVNSALEPFGCLGDLGWYCIRFVLWVMKKELPTRATGRILREVRDKNGAVAVEFSGEMFFANGVSSAFYCSFTTCLEQWAVVSGANGTLKVRDFVLPFFGSESRFETGQAVFNAEACDFNVEPHWRVHARREYSNSHPTSQETNLFRNFADQVRTGRLNEHWPEISWRTQRVMMACHESARRNGELVMV